MTARKAVRQRTPTKSAPRPTTGSTPEASGYGKALFTIIRKRLKSSSRQRAYPGQQRTTLRFLLTVATLQHRSLQTERE